jgi:hypothetical protein
MSLAIVVPTIPGREEDLSRCLEAYRLTAPDAKVYVEFGHPSCGAGWIAGAKKAAADGFDYLHLTNDDIEPHDGWLDVAVDTVNRGFIPAPLVYHPNGELESAGLKNLGVYQGPYTDWMYIEGTTIPFLTATMWDQIGMIPVHYCTDLWVSSKGRLRGYETVVRTEMRFTHHTAQAGRNYGRVPDDTREYLRLLDEARHG